MFIRPNIISVLELARDIIRNKFNEEYSLDVKYKILMIVKLSYNKEKRKVLQKNKDIRC